MPDLLTEDLNSSLDKQRMQRELLSSIIIPQKPSTDLPSIPKPPGSKVKKRNNALYKSEHYFNFGKTHFIQDIPSIFSK
jgi:hypothetical protein